MVAGVNIHFRSDAYHNLSVKRPYLFNNIINQFNYTSKCNHLMTYLPTNSSSLSFKLILKVSWSEAQLFANKSQ